jgi:hypothetical protein
MKADWLIAVCLQSSMRLSDDVDQR